MAKAIQTPLRAAAQLLHKSVTTIRTACSYLVFHLQNAIFLEWAMLGSNQRPLPCEGRSLCSQLFASVQKLLQTGKLVGDQTPTNLPELLCTGVLLVYQHA